MPRYTLSLSDDVCDRLLLDVSGMNPFPIERRYRYSTLGSWHALLTLSLTKEELAFLMLKYEMREPPHEITAVDVVGDLLA